METDEDELIMGKVGLGHVNFLEDLFDRHHLVLFRFFLRLTGNRAHSEDLVQEVFIRVLKYAASFRPGARFKPWFYQIARNVHHDHLSRLKPEDPLDFHSDSLQSFTDSPHAQVQRAQEDDLLKIALARLPPLKRELLLLSRDPDLSYQEIAVLFECTPEALKVRVHRALKDLREVFFELHGERP